MPISFACTNCGKTMRAPDAAAGKSGKCPHCATVLLIPLDASAIPASVKPVVTPSATPKPTKPPASQTAPATLPTQSKPTANKPAPTNPVVAKPSVSSAQSAPVAKTPEVSKAPASKPAKSSWVPSIDRGALWLRHLHWGLALAMIPLAMNVLWTGETQESLLIRMASTFQAAEEQGIQIPNEIEKDQLFQLLPEHKLEGALLAHDSIMHWVFAAISAVCFLGICCGLAIDNSAKPLHLLGLGLFTATCGVFLLLGFQMLAFNLPASRLRIRGWVGLILLLIALIGLSYNMASDPETGVLLSFVGFTVGVGFCEELCKALPLLVFYFSPNQQTWRGAFLWGLASGVGFGVSEGVMYSGDMYNGIATLETYGVRFISCVALHAIWSGSVGISIHQRQHLLREEREEGWGGLLSILASILVMIGIPMLLHGLYDTLLKKDMELFALITAAASFGYLAWQFQSLRGDDEDSERAKFVAEYAKQRNAMARG